MLPDSKTGPKVIQLPPPARTILNGLQREGRFVFPDKRGNGPMKDLGLRWRRLRGLAGLDDVRVHDCRHTFASHAVMSGLDRYTVGRVLGHADTCSTERYAHLTDEHVREAAGTQLQHRERRHDREGEGGSAMSGTKHRIRLTVKGIVAAKPQAKEYTLWDNLLAHFGVRV